MHCSRLVCAVVVTALFGCGGGGGDDGGTTGPPPPPTQTLGSITTSVTTLNLVAGSTQTIGVSALDTQGNPIASFAPSFTSANTTVAEVDGSGAVLGLTQGTTNITVTVTIGAVSRTASVAATVTGQLPFQGNVSTTAGDFFTPNKVAIQRGGQVTWTFGSTEHTVTFTTTGAPASIASGVSSSQSRTFAQAGTFSYMCTIHAGMNGQVVVR